MKCIICKKEKEKSREHIIPEALGNRKLITERVCEECNNYLGTKVDSILVDNPIVKLMRIDEGLKGKKGKQIKFFRAVETDVNTGIKFEMKGEEPKVKPHTISNEDGIIRIGVSNEEEGMEYIKKILSSENYSEEDIKYYCENARVFPEEKIDIEFEKNFSIDVLLFLLSVVKIAYEYTHYILGDSYLDDRIAHLFQKELYKAVESEKDDIKPSKELYNYVGPIMNNDINNLCNSDLEVRHVIVLVKNNNDLCCHIYLMLPKPMRFIVKVSENAGKYDVPSKMDVVLKNGEMIRV